MWGEGARKKEICFYRTSREKKKKTLRIKKNKKNTSSLATGVGF